jgi:hypothetical protein
MGACARAGSGILELPALSGLDALDVFPSILVKPTDLGLFLRIEDNDAELAKELADACAPTELLLRVP